MRSAARKMLHPNPKLHRIVTMMVRHAEWKRAAGEYKNAACLETHSKFKVGAFFGF